MAQMKSAETKVFKNEQEFCDAVQTESTKTQLEFIMPGVLNETAKDLRVREMFHFHGPSFTFPTVNAGFGSYTLLLGNFPNGLKFGAVFLDGPDAVARKFVVAVDTFARKVYVETGPNGPVDWDAVNVKLGMAGDTAEYYDPIFGGKAVARFEGKNPLATFSN